MPKIVAPLGAYENYDEIINSNADEFYIGIIPEYWKKIYGSIGLNRRDFSSINLETFDDLKRITALVHNNNKKISITLNNHYYTKEQNNLLDKYISDCIDCGIDNFIIADPGLMAMVRNIDKKIKLHVSGEAGCYSGYDILFYIQFGIERVIFPRDISIQEIKSAIQIANTSIEYEAFIFGPRCTYSGAYCTLTHGFINGPSFCSYKLKHNVYKKDMTRLSNIEMNRIMANFEDRNNWANNKKKKLSTNTCGICSIENLAKTGVEFLKIVGREFSLEENIQNIEHVSAAIIKAKTLPFNQDKIINTDSACQGGLACYYANETIQENEISLLDYRKIEPDRKINYTADKEIEHAVLLDTDVDLRQNLSDILALSHQKAIKYNYDISFVDRSFKRIYYGNEFCENKIPSVYDVEIIANYCQMNNLTFSLVLPPVSIYGIRNIIKLLNTLKISFPFEVICNSWGVIQLLKKYPGIQIVLGRLLNKIKHDPFVINHFTELANNYKLRHGYIEASTDDIIRYLSQSNINNPYFDKILRTYNISRIETDIPYQIFTDNLLRKSFYYPLQFVTMGRYCFWNGIDNIAKSKKFKPNRDCTKPCKSYFSIINSYDKELKLFGNGNAILSLDRDKNLTASYDRYVFDYSIIS